VCAMRPAALGLILAALVVGATAAASGLEEDDRRLALVAASRGLPDDEVPKEEAERRAKARSRTKAQVCLNEEEGAAFGEVGCAQESSLVESATYLVTFAHKKSGDDPKKCWVRRST